MKKITLLTILLLTVSHLSAQTVFSPEAKQLYNDFMELRISASTKTSSQESLNDILQFRESSSDLISQCSHEEELVIDSLIAMEKFNYLFDNKEKWPELKQELSEQKQKNDSFQNENPDLVLSKEAYTAFGNLISCWMVFSIGDVLKYGLSVKKYFDAALKIDPEYSYAHLSLAQWYYLSPKISGGSRILANNHYEKAIEYRNCSCDAYYGNIFLSQSYFEHKDYQLAEKLLNDAESYAPGSAYIQFIRRLNKDDTSLYKYNTNRANLSDKYK